MVAFYYLKPLVIPSNDKSKITRIDYKKGVSTRFRQERKWLVMFPDGKEKIVLSLSKFCIKHNLKYNIIVTGKMYNGYSAKKCF